MICRFNDIKDYSKVGNKAESLILMKKNGFNVPDGIVIDIDTYFQILKENNISDSINKLLTDITKENVKDISNKISTIFDGIKIDANIEKEILNMIDDRKKYAVRSSGTLEDLSEYSFAGQYRTILNVEKKDIINSIIDCYKSMFSETILSYILSNEIDIKKMAMTIIVQEMVDSELSGICFTIDPISGNDKEMLIEIGKGLGENIVSGKVVPEQYYYNWYINTYNYDENNKLLTKEMLEKISNTFFDIQYFYGYPCDIEFAIESNELYILQARKITSIKYKGYSDMWTTADFKDGGVSATICYPYMWSLYEYIWEYTLRKFLLDSKILNEREVSKKLGEMYFARPYWNLSVVKLAMSKIVGYKEREFDSEFGIKGIYEGDGKTTKISLKSIIKIIKIAIAQKKIVKTRNENAERYKEELLDRYFEYLKKYDDNEISDIEKEWYKLTHDDYLYSESTYFWQIFINTIHQSLYKDSLLKYVSETDYLTLLGSIENISHLLPFYSMWQISREIRNDEELLKYWEKTEVSKIISDINKNNDSNSNNKLKNVKDLVNEFGYHSDKELDVAYKCYFEDPSSLINSIKDMIKLDDEFSPEQDKENGKKAYEAILNDIKNKTSKNQFKKINNKIINMRKMLWWREEFRDVSTRFYYLIRIYTLKLAEKLKNDEVIENTEDIWFLKVGDIWDFLDKKKDKETIEKIIYDNKKYYFAYKNYMSENEIGQIFKDAAKKKSTNSQIKGLGANNGIVTGRARVIESFDEIDKIKENDILVTKFTDTGWTPKFAILSGIVTEYGGILCHAAIVSREYGIPAIVNCSDAMSKIKDGQIITIDGSTGIVTIEK